MREFRKIVGRTKRPQVWRIEHEGNKVRTEWGLLDGEMQNTTQAFKGVNIGKSNEKTPEIVALEFFEREIQGQLKTGWVEHDEHGKAISGHAATSIDFIELPQNLRFWKPNHDLTGHLKKCLESKDVIWTRKRNGNQKTLMKDVAGNWQMYSSTMAPYHKDEPGVPWLDRYPQILYALQKLNVPPRTILVGELVTSFKQDEEGFDIDDLLYVSSIVKSKSEEALVKQANGGWLTFSAFDIIYYDGKPWYAEMEASRRLGAIHDRISAVGNSALSHVEVFIKGEVIHSGGRQPFDFDGSYEAAMALAKEKDWEGFVLVDPKGTYADKGVNFGGKPQRPVHVAKVKPKFEADFVVMWDPDNDVGTWGKGKKSSGVGAVFAYLYDNGELKYVTKVGGGLSDELVKKFADPKLYPMVWTVEFASWTDHGSIQFPEFIRVREDKTPEECTTEQMPLRSAEEG